MDEVMTLKLTAEQLVCIRLIANAPHFPAFANAVATYAIPPERMAVLREVLNANGIEADWPVQYARSQERKDDK